MVVIHIRRRFAVLYTAQRKLGWVIGWQWQCSGVKHSNITSRARISFSGDFSFIVNKGCPRRVTLGGGLAE